MIISWSQIKQLIEEAYRNAATPGKDWEHGRRFLSDMRKAFLER